MTQTVDNLRLDGNAAAGLLQELFAFEITTATAICEACGVQSAIGALLLYGQELGAVLRCPGCDEVMMVVTRPHDEWRLDMRGVRTLCVASAPAASEPT